MAGLLTSYTLALCPGWWSHTQRKPDSSSVLVCVHVSDIVCPCVFCRLYVALHHLTGAKPSGMTLLYLTLGWTYTAHQRCNKSIPGCQNLSESFCACEQHIFRFPHLRADVCLTHRHTHRWNAATHSAVCDFQGERDSERLQTNQRWVCVSARMFLCEASVSQWRL